MPNYESNEAENFPSPPIKKDVLSPDSPPISPDNPPWNSWTAFGVWAASVVFIIIFPNLFLLPYLTKQSVYFTNQAAVVEFAKNDPTAVLLQISAIIPAHILTLVLAWLVVTRFKKFSFRETLGWRWNGFNIWTCLAIVGGFFVLAGIASYYFPEQDNDLLRILKSSRTAVYIVAFLATFTAPLVEEVVYRGVLYSAFQRTVGVPAAVALITFLFALVHVPQYYPSYSTIFLICLLSLVLTLVRVRTKNLLPCIALHTVFNGSQSVLLILQPYLETLTENNQSPAASFIHLFK
ncbi:MAG: CPBP family intramembrane metalloprotease [Pyrinomonadaceae bacterium]|nr:CPBP family intramembrane metalloprotease [Pyrinomonadaceae bacterium]